ncbi:MAG: AI-2E family transporter [Thermoanaerobaculia bacterium]
MQPRDREPGWTWNAGAVLRSTAIALTLVILLLLVWKIRSIVIVGFFGILFGMLLSRATGWLERLHVRRGLGAPLIVLAFIGALVGVGFLTAPTLREQSAEVRKKLPQVIEQIEQQLGIDAKELGRDIADGVGLDSEGQEPGPAGVAEGADAPQRQPEAKAEEGGAGGLQKMVTSNLGRIRGILFPVASAAVDMVAALLIVIFLAMFVAIRPDHYRRGVLRLFPERSRGEAEETFEEVGSTLRQWIIARLIAMVAVGAIVGISLAVMRVPGALALGVLAGLLEFIPFFGPVAAALPAIGIAMLDSPQKALWVLILFVIVQQLEGNVIGPLLLQSRVDIPPALTLITVPALMIVFGLVGALIAEPLLAVGLVLTRRLWVEQHADRMG